eukprot:11147553-Alexandrium_andersonii.AAC.1
MINDAGAKWVAVATASLRKGNTWVRRQAQSIDGSMAIARHRRQSCQRMHTIRIPINPSRQLANPQP